MKLSPTHFPTAVWILMAGLAAVIAQPLTPANAADIDWEVVHRFRLFRNADNPASFITAPNSKRGVRALPPETHWDFRTQRYSAELMHPAEWTVRLSLPANFGAACIWSFRAKGNTKDIEPPRTAPCKDPVDVSVTADGMDVRATDGDGRTAAATIDVRDLLLVSIGDSYASGEGNPDIAQKTTTQIDSDGRPYQQIIPPLWLDQRCHRSLLAGPAQAALRLAHDNKRVAVTFISFACSGAEVFSGLLDRYIGRETPLQMNQWMSLTGLGPDAGLHAADRETRLDDQVLAVQRATCPRELLVTNDGTLRCPARARAIDALMISIGGNDVRFGPILTTMIMEREALELPGLPRELTDSIARLPFLYDQLAEQIEAKLAPNATLVTEYPNPVYAGANACGSDTSHKPIVGGLASLFVGLDKTKNEYAAKKILPEINRQMESASKRNGWHYVGNIAIPSAPHGYCVTNGAWFHAYKESVTLQGELPIADDGPGGFSPGVMHPNHLGHRLYADALVQPLSVGLLESTPLTLNITGDLPRAPQWINANTPLNAALTITASNAAGVVLGGGWPARLRPSTTFTSSGGESADASCGCESPGIVPVIATLQSSTGESAIKAAKWVVNLRQDSQKRFVNGKYKVSHTVHSVYSKSKEESFELWIDTRPPSISVNAVEDNVTQYSFSQPRDQDVLRTALLTNSTQVNINLTVADELSGIAGLGWVSPDHSGTSKVTANGAYQQLLPVREGINSLSGAFIAQDAAGNESRTPFTLRVVRARLDGALQPLTRAEWRTRLAIAPFDEPTQEALNRLKLLSKRSLRGQSQTANEIERPQFLALLDAADQADSTPLQRARGLLLQTWLNLAEGRVATDLPIAVVNPVVTRACKDANPSASTIALEVIRISDDCLGLQDIDANPDVLNWVNEHLLLINARRSSNEPDA